MSLLNILSGHTARNFPFIQYLFMGEIVFPGGSVGKEATCNGEDAGHMGSIPGSGRSLGGGHGNPLQYSCLEKPMDREAWLATVHSVAKNQTRLSN